MIYIHIYTYIYIYIYLYIYIYTSIYIIFNGHNTGFCHHEKQGYYDILTEHFNVRLCKEETRKTSRKF